MKRRIGIPMLSILALILMAQSAGALPLFTAPLGTAFTYQGRLTDSGNPANGTFDFEFDLFDDASAGSPVGSTVTKDDVTVADGLFTVQLDFGDVFDGTALWLEIGVRDGVSVGPYTTLTPRQPLTATPYALYAAKAPWDGLTGVPAGFADGTDDGATYDNVLVVAKSGGDYTTISAALSSITTNSDTDRWLIYVAPGVYNEQVTMKPYVDIQGSGELNTKITFGGSSGYYGGTTVLGASNAELRFLTVENTGGDDYALGMFNSGTSPRITHVTIDVTAGAVEGYGVYSTGSSLTLTDVSATVTGSGSANVQGLYIDSAAASLENVTVTAAGENYTKGVFNWASTVTLTHVTVSATGGSGAQALGIRNFQSNLTLTDSTVTAAGGTSDQGLNNEASSGSYTVLVTNSRLTSSSYTISSDTEFSTYVAASQLSGGAALAGGGTLTCAGVYDENYVWSDSTCP